MVSWYYVVIKSLIGAELQRHWEQRWLSSQLCRRLCWTALLKGCDTGIERKRQWVLGNCGVYRYHPKGMVGWWVVGEPWTLIPYFGGFFKSKYPKFSPPSWWHRYCRFHKSSFKLQHNLKQSYCSRWLLETKCILSESYKEVFCFELELIQIKNPNILKAKNLRACFQPKKCAEKVQRENFTAKVFHHENLQKFI